MIIRHGAQLGSTTVIARPIQVVLFDAFDTLVSPRIAPHLQYAEEARRAGLQEVDDERMSTAFKQAFKRLSVQHPLYGKHTSLSGPRAWWSLLIKETMLNSGMDATSVQDVLPHLTTNILNRFSSKEAYRLSGAEEAEVVDTLSSLQTLGVHSSLATNSDSAILLACKDLGLANYLNLETREREPKDEENVDTTSRVTATLSYDVGFEKPDIRFFREAVQRAWSIPRHSQSIAGSTSLQSEQSRAAATLYVGDDFHQDIVGATNAGLQAAWINRGGKSQPEGASPTHCEIDTLLDVAQIVRESHSKYQ